ncbi:methyltransferase [Colwellia sp. D2M02]|uniref:Ribosomal RNA large subunit methyltransferase G n=1 Tax=Colwellia asteriadis TaxID=517723 RepID=A0ABN1LB02_9GAMM|nr:methyltransferase [Colwellia sp. D2M02]MBU2894334.1 methyltransferase [Colwellia sp. D2M02]
MISPFIVNDKNLFLTRFPVAQVNRDLQAWDAADEYLINHITEHNLINENSHVVIFNDSFGALATSFCQPSLSPASVTCVNDSYISAQGIRHNISENNLDDSKVTLRSSLDKLPENIDIILFKIPKSKSMLIEQLIQIKNNVNDNTVFIAADRAKEIHSSTLKVFEKYLGTTKTSLAVKKARLVFCQFDNKQQHQSPFPTIWSLDDKNTSQQFTISNHANVYAREKLDIGARYFIENLPKVNEGCKVIDLGCGNGVIGLTVLAQQPTAQIQFFDESFMAIASAEANVNTNLPEHARQCTFNLNDCLTDVESNSVDLILCNPPFHQQTATTDHIAWQMFKDSYRVLKKGGELRIIGNRQLAYHIKLKRIFGNETLIASNDKFVTQSAIKK